MRDDRIAEADRPRFRAAAGAAGALRLPHHTGHTLAWYRETQVNHVAANVTHIAWRVRGHRAAERFHAAVHAAIERHDVLQARVALLNGVPHMRFAMGCEVAGGAAGSSAHRMLAELIWAPLEHGAVFRPFIVEMSADECLCGFVLSHFIVDLNACDILALDLYATLRRQEEAVPPSRQRPLQYRDYIRAMVEWLGGPGIPYRVAHWRRQMSAAPAVCLPAAVAVDPTAVGRLNTVDFAVDPSLRRALAEAARTCGVTLARVLLAAKFVALSGVLGQRDLVVTAIVSGRDDAALLGFVGNTADCVPIRAPVDPGSSFAELIRELQAAYALACRHRIRWELLLEALGTAGSGIVAPTFNYIRAGLPQPVRAARTAAPPVAIERAPLLEQPAQYGNASQHTSHNMHLFDTGTCLRGHVKYLSSRYDEAAMRGFVDQFMTCLRRIAADPREVIGRATV